MFSQRPKQSLESVIQAGYRYACALQTDPGEARGLVHEAWIRANKMHGRVPDKTLLFRCVRNIHIDQYRRSKIVQYTANDEMSSFVGDMDVAEIPDAALQRALMQLRDVERESLFLSAVEGYTADEIAKLTGKSRGTILSLILRARNKLKTLMLEDNVTPLRRTGNRDIE